MASKVAWGGIAILVAGVVLSPGGVAGAVMAAATATPTVGTLALAALGIAFIFKRIVDYFGATAVEAIEEAETQAEKTTTAAGCSAGLIVILVVGIILTLGVMAQIGMQIPEP